jgi:hypothetical protein
MRPQGRKLFLIVFGIPLLLAVPFVLLGTTVVREGMMEVHVAERSGGQTVDVRIPAAIVPAAAGLWRTCSVGNADCRIDPEARAALHVASDILGVLGRTPDGVLVEVRTRDEIVLIEKRGGMLHVNVDSPDDVVQLKVPLGAARSALAML